ncbi:MAG: ATP-binding protein [Bacteroidota bacterium]
MIKPIYRPRKLLLGIGLFLLFGIIPHLKAQSPFGFIRNFSPAEYSGEDFVAGPQNWGAVQNAQGLIFVSNNSGVLSFDGERWQMVGNTQGRGEMELGRSQNGEIYLADDKEIGIIKADSAGKLYFRSLSALLAEAGEISKIKRIRTIGQQVIFQTEQSLIFWDESEQSFSTWTSPAEIGAIATRNDQLFLWLSQKGLYRFAKQDLIPLSQQSPPEFKTIALIAGRQANEWLLVSKEQGIFKLENNRFEPFSALGRLFPRLTIRDAIRLEDGSLGIATDGEGILLLDPQGQLLEQIDTRSGLLTNSIISLDQDREGNLWMGMDVGIAVVPIPLVLRRYTDKQGVKGTVIDMQKWRNQLFIGTTLGLYSATIDAKSLSNLRIRPISETVQEVWGFDTLQNQLLIASSTGVKVWDGENLRALGPSGPQEYRFCFFRSPRFAERLYVGLGDGLGLINLAGTEPIWQGRVEGIEHEVRSIQEDAEGNLWVAREEVSAFPLTENPLRAQPISNLKSGAGFDAEVVEVELTKWNNTLYFGSELGLLVFDEVLDSLILDSAFAALPQALKGVYVLRTDEQERLWMTTDLKPVKHGYLQFKEGKMEWYDQQFRSIRTDVWSIYPQNPQTVWMAGTQNLYRVDISAGSKAVEPFFCLIRELRLNGDSVIFSGNHADKNGFLANEQPENAKPKFPAEIREVDFKFISPLYSASLQPLYSYRLEGYEEQWSDWKAERIKSYTALREGKYTFHVRAKDSYGRISQTATYSFQIMPPWYRTWWAFLLYSAIIAGLLYLVVLLRLRQQSRQLAQKERELALEREATEKLRKLDLLKDEFLATTSHELRTPLQGIIGLAESLRDRIQKQDHQTNRRNLDLIVSSGQRLASLVNDILDFSRLKTYTIDLQLKGVNLHALSQLIVQINQTLIGGKDLRLHNEVPQDLPLLLADENRLQQILQNLIGNAIKFTEKGHIRISVPRRDEKEVIISVSDTGIGIPPEMQDVIFHEFQQGDSSISRQFGGTGLGLSISRRLVELHQGRIWVESEEGGGTNFLFSIPLAPADVELGKSLPESRISRPQVVDKPSLQIPSTSPSKLNQARILVVDDEPINQQVLQNHMLDQPYQLTIASSGQEALDLIEENGAYDLVLLDVMMPLMSGYEVCERIRERYLPSECPVIMITAKNQVQDLLEGFETGANDYLPKPFSKDELLARIKTHLNLHRIHHQTARFVPKEFLKVLGRDTVTELQLGDSTHKRVTVLFSDIRDYTVLAESLSPEDTFRFVNAFVGRMGPIIRDNHGFVQQYLGDGIMSLFQREPEDSLKAAIGMQQALNQYNESRKEKKRREIHIGIGMHTGPLIMGIIGDELRADTATISDTVNTASRMEGLCKYFGASIILSEGVHRQIKQPERYNFRWIGEVQVKGKKEPVGIYECLDGYAPELKARKMESAADFAQGVALFVKKDFETAVALFEKIYAQNPSDLAARNYLQRATQYIDYPPKAGWEGIWMLTGK